MLPNGILGLPAALSHGLQEDLERAVADLVYLLGGLVILGLLLQQVWTNFP